MQTAVVPNRTGEMDRATRLRARTAARRSRYSVFVNGVSTLPGPPGPGFVSTRPRANAGRVTALIVGWASVVLVPVAGVVSMVADNKAGWGAFVYIIAVGPCQAIVHIVLAVLFQVAQSNARERPVSPWIPLAYAVYLLAFLGASFLFLDAGDTPVYYSPWRESADLVVMPLIRVSVAALVLLFAFTVVDLAASFKARDTTQYRPLPAPLR
ncbi:hypothetical protein SAMN04487766_101365 [Actinomyces ruminicola]|uniref:Uncharacterized protein n=1 Tax=Actinomyces ruminicola TaxID=332524 RepID=A0A1G9SAC4_9ACTO|nr:hypothetical protein SAMN04487766_101365 [Actinomyces ruminicola]